MLILLTDKLLPIVPLLLCRAVFDGSYFNPYFFGYRMAATFKCWLCPELFTNWSGLKTHLSSTAHKRLHVICPFCTSETLFRRMSDLRHHASRHRRQLRDKLDLLEEENQFWFTTTPQDYLHLVEGRREMDYDAPTAIEARAAVRHWLHRAKRPSRNMTEWEKGWALAKGSTPSRKRGSQVMDSEEAPKIPRRASPDKSPLYRSPLEDLYQEGPTCSVWCPGDLSAEDPTQIDIAGHLSLTPTPPPAPMISNLISPISTPSKVGTPPPIHPDSTALPSFDAVPHPSPKQPDQEMPLNLATPPAEHSTPLNLAKYVQPSTVTGASNSISSTKCLQNPSEMVPLNLCCVPRQTRMSDIRKETPISSCKRALAILSRGLMPTVPPGRRAWDKEEVISIPLMVGSILWPPRGWKKLSCEERQDAWEFSAAQLETFAGFPRGDKLSRLDKYNMLALPGCKPLCVPPRSMREDFGILAAKARFYNYQTLAQIANGQDPPGGEKTLEMFEAQIPLRSTDTDYIIRHIEAAGVPLRLIPRNEE